MTVFVVEDESPTNLVFVYFLFLEFQDGLATNSSSYLAISFLPDSFPHIKATLRRGQQKTLCPIYKRYLSQTKNIFVQSSKFPHFPNPKLPDAVDSGKVNLIRVQGIACHAMRLPIL